MSIKCKIQWVAFYFPYVCVCLWVELTVLSFLSRSVSRPPLWNDQMVRKSVLFRASFGSLLLTEISITTFLTACFVVGHNWLKWWCETTRSSHKHIPHNLTRRKNTVWLVLGTGTTLLGLGNLLSSSDKKLVGSWDQRNLRIIITGWGGPHHVSRYKLFFMVPALKIDKHPWSCIAALISHIVSDGWITKTAAAFEHWILGEFWRENLHHMLIPLTLCSYSHGHLLHLGNFGCFSTVDTRAIVNCLC